MRTAAACLLFLLTIPVAAQATYTIQESTRLPADSYVGDPVELRVTIRTEASVAEPETVPQPAWGNLESVRIIPRGSEYGVRLVVVPFEPGTLILPPIPLGEIRLEGLSIIVSSVLGAESEELRPVYSPQELPGSRAVIILIGFSLVFTISLALYLLGPGRRHIAALVARYNASRPFKRLVRDLGAIGTQIPATTARVFYTDIVAALQRFMTEILGRQCDSATSSEIAAMLPRARP